MEKYIEILDSLMKAKKEKKKKEPTIKEKEAFRSAWLSLVADAGLTGSAEQFLYEGFAFCGAEPFYAYLIQTEDQNATLAAMFSGKYYGIDSNVSFRLVAHLLALMLNNNATRNILAPIIKRLPGACVNKDKKRLGTAEKTFEKYFLAELHPDVELCPLADIGTKPVFIKEFVTLVSSIMDGIENAGSAKGVVVKNIAKIRKWLADYDTSQSASTDTKAEQLIPASTIVAAEKVKIVSVADNPPEDRVQAPKVIVTQPKEEASVDMIAYVDLPENLRTHQNTASFLDRFKVVAGNLPYAQTIVAHIARDGHYFIHPDIEQNRSITPREAARIQTFPDNYCFESKKGTPSRTLAFKQIGNAVPVCLAYHIALSLLARFADQN